MSRILGISLLLALVLIPIVGCSHSKEPAQVTRPQPSGRFPHVR
jgi:hypothetical protein